jgi:hypothetical protein
MEYDELNVAKEEYERYKNELGDDHPATLTSLNNLADLLAYYGNFNRASTMFEDARFRRRPPRHTHHANQS